MLPLNSFIDGKVEMTVRPQDWIIKILKFKTYGRQCWLKALGKFLYSLNGKILVLKFSGGMLQDTQQECFGNVMILHKYVEDILPILQIETTIRSSLLAG